MEIFSKIWPKSKIFRKFDPNRNSKFHFIEIFPNFRKKSKFSEILTKIEIFRKFDQIETRSKFPKQSKFFRNCHLNWNFSKILPRSTLFEIFNQIEKNFRKNRNFSENFAQKSKILVNLPQIEIFRKFD